MDLKLSKDQADVLKKILLWYTDSKSKPYITLGGYAGTGKTTLISLLRRVIYQKINKDLKVAFCSYTGRAVRVLKNILSKSGSFYPQDFISTIHGLMYKPIEDSKGVIIGWQKKDFVNAGLIIIDEGSMVNERIWGDLLSYGIPIIAVGDHGQLPPIRGKFNLMENPELKLERIYRQARDNPIIKVSKIAREKGEIPVKKFAENVEKIDRMAFDAQDRIEELIINYQPDTLVLCGYNITRNKINSFIRNDLGFDSPNPLPGDRVICLRNNHDKEIYNGMLGTIKNINISEKDWYEATIQMDDENNLYQGKIYASQFGAVEPINFTKNRIKAKDRDLFDYGYALTVHKAQGSQAKKVILFEERNKYMDNNEWKKWLYTGVTRAEEELYVVGYGEEEAGFTRNG